MKSRTIPLPTFLAAIAVMLVVAGLHVINQAEEPDSVWHPIEANSMIDRELHERKLRPEYFESLSPTDAFIQLVRLRLRPDIVTGRPIGYTPMMVLQIGTLADDQPLQLNAPPAFSFEDVFQSMERSGRCIVLRHRELIVACFGRGNSRGGGIIVSKGAEHTVRQLRQIQTNVSLEGAKLRDVLSFYETMLHEANIQFNGVKTIHNGDLLLTTGGERPNDLLDHMNAVFFACSIKAVVNSNGISLR